MTEYPEEWICKTCGNQLKNHIKKGSPDKVPGTGAFVPAKNDWCFPNYEPGGIRQTWAFIPLDNLTLIETLAKEVGITEEIPQGNTPKINE